MESIHIILVDKGDSYAVSVGTGGTSYTVNIVFGIVRNVIIDNHCNVVNVYSARNDVGSDKNINLSALEFIHHFVALCLVKVGVHFPTVDLQAL